MKKVSIFIIILLIIGIVFNIVSGALALVLGLALGLLGFFDKEITHKSVPLQSALLKISVIGLGFGINATNAFKIGSQGLYISFSTIVITFGIAFALKWMLGSEKKLTILIASGTAICGGSAIAAVSPTIKANASQTSISLAVVFILNAFALIIFPPLGKLLELSNSQFGIWCALAIHDTSSVVGASHAFSEESMLIATTAKLVRAFWIVPLVLIISLTSGFKGKSSFPWFILGFVVAVIISTYIPGISVLSSTIVWISRKLLVLTLFLIGIQITIQKIKQLGIKSFFTGFVTWIILSVLSLFYVIYMI